MIYVRLRMRLCVTVVTATPRLENEEVIHWGRSVWNVSGRMGGGLVIGDGVYTAFVVERRQNMAAFTKLHCISDLRGKKGLNQYWLKMCKLQQHWSFSFLFVSVSGGCLQTTRYLGLDHCMAS